MVPVRTQHRWTSGRVWDDVGYEEQGVGLVSYVGPRVFGLQVLGLF